MSPYVDPTAYVDNLAWSTELQEAHGPAIDQLQCLVQATKMQIDWGKTYFWATHAAQRSWWKKGSSLLLPPGIEVPVLYQVKELGAHLSFCKRRGLGHLIDTFDQAVDRLHRLFHDPSSLATKAHVVQTGVWPFAFYGALAVAPGRQRLHKLRSNAARAIVGRHHTLSPMASLYFLPCVTDPETYLMAYQACHLSRTARIMPDVARAVLKTASRPGAPLTVHGPGTALQLMFGRLGWTIKPDGQFRGPGNVFFDVFASSVAEIKQAMQLSWAVEVQEAVRDRSGLGNFPLPSRDITQKLFSHFQPWEQTILARHVTGAFLSNAEKATWSRIVGPECDFCGEQDTKYHRLFTCRAFADVRHDHAEILSQVACHFPWWSHLLAASEPEDAAFLRLVCSSRSLPPLVAPPLASPNLYIFTDGSAHNGTCAEARVAYWSVVHCHSLTDIADLPDWDMLPVRDKVSGFRIVAQGCAPRSQTVPRAEVAAVVWAANWAAQLPHAHAIIFTDSQYAIDQWHKAANPSLLNQVGCTDLMMQLPISPNLELRKVKAHNPQGHLDSASAYLRWTTMGNEFADAAARQARSQELEVVRQSSDSIAESHSFQLDHSLAFSKYLIDLNVAVIDRKDELAEVPAAAQGVEQIREVVWSFFREWDEYSLEDGIRPNLPEDAEQRLVGQQVERDYDRRLLQWLKELMWPSRPLLEECPPNITYMELFVAFTIHAGQLPPVEIMQSRTTRFFAFDSPEAMQVSESSVNMISRFVRRIRSLETALGRDLVLATEVTGIARLGVLGVDIRLAGLDSRPDVGDACAWVPAVLQWSRQFADSSFLHDFLLRRNNAEG